MRLNGEDPAFLDQHTANRDQVILVRLIDRTQKDLTKIILKVLGSEMWWKVSVSETKLQLYFHTE